MNIVLLSEEQVRRKCHFGQGERMCRYLVFGDDGWECYSHRPLLADRIDQRVKNGAQRARGARCANPRDLESESEAV